MTALHSGNAVPQDHFTEVRNGPMYESDAHLDNGVSCGDSSIYRLSAHLSALLTEQRPAGRTFTANGKHNSRWLCAFCFGTGTEHNGPDFVIFKRGLKSDRWYAEAAYL